MKPHGALPQTMTLKPSRLRWIFVFLVGASFSAAALFVMTTSEPLARWGVFGFFLLVALVATPGVIGVGSQLDLDREGFTCKTPLKTFRRKWTECSAFSPVSVGLNSFVGFSSVTDEASKPGLAAINRSIIGASGMLPDRYGMSAGNLADLMNRFRVQAMGG